ncbi:uncharacterized protein LOC119070751 isoform X2 [Bradysia coprophila]|uniref:uncharacterized protein LOC119070751 isoform X2 n=1 Tax=Bradysia coprophila TaxID=38358 RepID=UPI00187DC1AF|nr:uncharacterized protein LOC119070751 isoform X2 [Bradysia coprophila]
MKYSFSRERLLFIVILLLNSSIIASLATSDSFPTSDQSSQNDSNSGEKSSNSTELHHGSELYSDNNAPTAPSEVLENVNKFGDKIEEKLVESRTESGNIESVIERNDLGQATVDDTIDRSDIAVLLDSISTNSGINGIPDIPATAPIVTLVEKISEINLESTVEEDTEDISHNNTQSPVTDLPNDSLKSLDAIYDPDAQRKEQPDNASSPPPVQKDEIEIVQDVPPDEQINMINDSGGTGRTDEDTKAESNEVYTVDAEAVEKAEVNLTEEEIPVFSEWAQKHLEEAEKKLEKEAVNTSTMKKNSTQGHKTPVVKLRAKNYASPDCGAKIIAANSEASSTGSVLTTTKDEYLLSPCTSRIWFVVELCEAIQAEVIDLANFELFSSSPKNFSVSVSNRFPTREWSNVGRFTAKDERDIQSFDLFPHLFGKYVRVDIHSHYNSEHFCPISLFRVYGTSEFEAFETENRIHSVDDDDDDDEDEDVGEAKHNENNIFKSASDVVMSIVKKAAASFVKPNEAVNNRTEEAGTRKLADKCMTPNFVLMCKHCSSSLAVEVNNLLNCEMNVLNRILTSDVIRQSIYKSQICANLVGLDLSLSCSSEDVSNSYLTDMSTDYVLHMFPVRYVAAMCNVLGVVDKKLKNVSYVSETNGAKDGTNLTIDKMGGDKLLMPNMILSNEDDKLKNSKNVNIETVKPVDSSTEQSQERDVLVADTIADSSRKETEEAVATQIQAPPLDVEAEQIIATDPVDSSERKYVTDLNENREQQQQSTHDEAVNVKTDGMNGSWENIDNLLSTPVPEIAEVHAYEENVNGALTSHQPGQKVHSESVFLRLSNRIKALERNMSLSGQYLEELSRRYKKQVEELQLAFARSLNIAEEQAKRNFEREQQFYEQTQQLRRDIESLSENFFSWTRITVIFVGFAFLQISIILIVVKIWIRRYLERIGVHPQNDNQRGNTDQAAVRERRRSTDAVKGAVPRTSQRKRRPSEEALQISGTYKELMIQDDIVDIGPDYEEYDSFVETRKKGYGHGISEQPLLDEDYDIYVPGNDLAYNEFMPDGPSGSDARTNNGSDTPSSTGSTKKPKSRRLSSPAFLKSPFSRQNSKKSETTTGWEWYRLKRGSNTSQSKSKSESPEVRVNGFNGNVPPVNNLQSSNDSLKTTSSTVNAIGSEKKPGSFRKILKKVF